MKPIIMLGTALLLLAGGVAAQENPGVVQEPRVPDRWQGYLIDAETAKELVGNPVTIAERASAHPKSTALELGERGGFGIIENGRWLKFDDEGNALAVDLIRNSPMEKGIKVTVQGHLKDEGTIAVTSMVEHDLERPMRFN